MGVKEVKLVGGVGLASMGVKEVKLAGGAASASSTGVKEVKVCAICYPFSLRSRLAYHL